MLKVAVLTEHLLGLPQPDIHLRKEKQPMVDSMAPRMLFEWSRPHDEDIEEVRLLIAGSAKDTADCKDLLQVLGLMPDQIQTLDERLGYPKGL